MRSKKLSFQKKSKRKSLKGGNKYEIPLNRLTLEQICNQAGYKNSDGTSNSINTLTKSESSSSLTGGVISKIKDVGSAVTWFPRKVLSVAMNTTGLDKIINSNNPSSTDTQVYVSNNTNIPENNTNTPANNNSKRYNCLEDIDSLCNSCNEPNQLLSLHNKVVTRIKGLNKNFFDTKLHNDISNLKIIELKQVGGKIKSNKKKNKKRKKTLNNKS